MKKIRTTLFVCLTALAVLTAFGCKGAQDLGKDAGKWGGQSVDKAGVPKTLTLTANNGGIDFYCFTDENGVVVEGYTTSGTVENKDGRITFDFRPIMNDKTTQTYTLYIHQPDVKPTKSGDKANAVAGSRDFRGTVTIQSGGAVKINASDYKEEVTPVGILPIFCNEVGANDVVPSSPTGMKNGNNHGDYTIKQIIPLEPEDKTLTIENATQVGTKYQKIQGLQFDVTIPETETKKLIMPAQEYPYALTLAQDQYVVGQKPDDNNMAKNKDVLWVKIVKVKAHVDNSVLKSSEFVNAKINKNSYAVQASVLDTGSYVLEPVLPGEK